jgi:hypothetical protein
MADLVRTDGVQKQKEKDRAEVDRIRSGNTTHKNWGRNTPREAVVDEWVRQRNEVGPQEEKQITNRIGSKLRASKDQKKDDQSNRQRGNEDSQRNGKGFNLLESRMREHPGEQHEDGVVVLDFLVLGNGSDDGRENNGDKGSVR